MKSYLAHYKNKYPGGQVQMSENSLDVYDADNNHRVALRKGGNGQWMDVGAEIGASDKHCLSPIPKNTRVYKHYNDGRVGHSEEHLERAEIAKVMAGKKKKVLSIEEYKSYGVKFDLEGNAIPDQKAPVKASVEAPVEDAE